MFEKDTPMSLVGSDVLGLITSGMYDNPLTVYREYIQNSADAIASAGDGGEGRVEIKIDPSRLCVTIRDNGPGLTHEAAVRALLPIAQSQKHRESDRGFRGIGRLAALAFSNSVTFLTRTRSDRLVTRIAWDGSELRRRINGATQTESVIAECVTVEKLAGLDQPKHFFEVQITGIGRYAAGLILNRNAVRNYIAEVCPVPFASTFPLASEIKDLLEKGKRPLVLNVFLDGEVSPVTRRFAELIRFSEDRTDSFTELEEVEVPSLDRSGSAAVGWIAHSSYLGAIPKGNGIRGLRARIGNIQIGDETIFDTFFPEERFNRWCVGEIHILDPRIVPNGRRDFFEPGPHVRNLENHVRTIARRISTRCRTASSLRHKESKFQISLRHLEEAFELATSGYLSKRDAEGLVDRAMNRIQEVRDNIRATNGHVGKRLQQLEELEAKLGSFEPRCEPTSLQGIKESEIAAYRKVFQTLAEISPSPGAAKEMIEAVLARSQSQPGENV